MLLASIRAPTITVLSLQLSVYYSMPAGSFSSLWQTNLQPLLQHHWPPLTFPSVEMEIWGGAPLPFPFSSRLRPSRLSRRSQDVLKSGILLLMDSKHHKKFIRKRRIVKVPGRALGWEWKVAEWRSAIVFLNVEYLNEPVLFWVFFFTKCSEIFYFSPLLHSHTLSEVWQIQMDTKTLTLRSRNTSRWDNEENGRTKLGISQIWQLVPFQARESDRQISTVLFPVEVPSHRHHC